MRVKRNMPLMVATIMLIVMITGCGSKNDNNSTNDIETNYTSTSDDSVSSVSGKIATSVSIANGDPKSFTPLKQTGNGKNPLNEIFEALVERDGFGGDMYGVIAKDWAFDGDDLVVNLYDYVYDSAGNQITASDVVFCYEYAYSQGITNSQYLVYTTGAEAVSDTQVVFHFNNDQIDVYDNLFTLLSQVYIYSQAAWESSADQMANDPIGTGPYTLTSFTSGASAVLTRNSNYWQTDESLIKPQHVANVEEINYKFITDAAQSVNALMTGEIDYLDGVSSEAVATFENSPGWEVGQTYTHNCFAIFTNALEDLPCNDINLRAAILYAINADDVIDAIGGPDYARKSWVWGVDGTSLYNPEWENATDNFYAESDLSIAKNYLDKSAYNGETINIVYNSGQYNMYFEPISLILASAFDELGIKYTISALTDDLFSAMSRTPESTDWDVMITNSGSDGTLMKFYQNYFNTLAYKGGLGNYKDSVLDQKFATVFSETGATQENMDDLVQYINDQFYCKGLFEPATYYVFNSNLIQSADVRTFRSWVIPGSFVYK